MAGYEDFASPVTTQPSAQPAASGYEAFASPVGAAPAAPEDTRYSGFGPLAPAARGFEDFTNYAADPFGLRDEISGIGAAAIDYVPKLFEKGFWTGETAGAMEHAGGEYSKAVDESRARTAEADKTFGRWRYVPEVVGGLGTSQVAKGFKMASSLGRRVLQSAITGGEYGALAGFGHSEGGVGERVEGAGEGALAGAVLGPAISEVGVPVVSALARGVKSGGQSLAGAVRSLRSRDTNVDARLNTALQAQNTPPRIAQQMLDEAQQAAKFPKTQLNPQMTIADLGPVTRDLADTAALVSPEARGLSGKFLFERARGQFARVNDYLRRAMGVTRGDFATEHAKIIDEQRAMSKTAYDAFRNLDVRIPVGDVLYNAQIEDMAAAPALKKTLERAREQFVANRTERDLGVDIQTRKPVKVAQADTLLTPARFDAGKRALDDMIEEAQRGGRGNEARLLVNLKNDLVAVADKATERPMFDPKTSQPVLDANGKPATESLYAKARDVYGSRADMLDALESGRTFMRGDSEMTGAQYRALSTAEKRMFRIGVAREVRKELGRKGLNSDMIGYFDRPNTRDVLEEIMTPKQAQRFYQLVELEQGLAATNTAVRGNSATARREQNILDFSLKTRLGRLIKDGNVVSALKHEIYDQVTKFFAMRDGDAVALTKAMFETDPAAQRATLDRLAQTYGKGHTRAVINRAQRALKQKMATMRHVLSGVTGELAGDAYSKKSPQPQIGYGPQSP